MAGVAERLAGLAEPFVGAAESFAEGAERLAVVAERLAEADEQFAEGSESSAETSKYRIICIHTLITYHSSLFSVNLTSFVNEPQMLLYIELVRLKFKRKNDGY